MAYISYKGYSRHTIHSTRFYTIRNKKNTCSLQLAELTETDYQTRGSSTSQRTHTALNKTVNITGASIPNGIFREWHAESASSVICASVLLNFARYTSRSSYTPSSLLHIAPLVHPDKSGLSIQHHVEVGLSCRETHTLPVLRDLAGPLKAVESSICNE